MTVPAHRDSSSTDLGMTLPLAVLGLAAWQALPTLVEAWNNDLYAAGAPLAFGLWLASQGWVYFKQCHLATKPCLAWLSLSLLLCSAGSMTDLRVLHHLALATAVPGLLGLGLGGVITSAAAPAWLPATGWFLSHWNTGGLIGWERPSFASIMALLLLAIARFILPPPHLTPPAP